MVVCVCTQTTSTVVLKKVHIPKGEKFSLLEGYILYTDKIIGPSKGKMRLRFKSKENQVYCRRLFFH